MALLQHLFAIILATLAFPSAIECLVVPSNNATNNTTQQNNNSATTMPAEIILTLTTENETITLNLTKNKNIPSDVPVVVAENGAQTAWKSNSGQFAVYYDMNSSASIVIEMKKQNGQMIKSCRGTLSINGIYYSVQPVDNNYGNRSSEEFLVDIEGVDHVMMMEDAELDFADPMNSTASQKTKPNGVNLNTILYDWPSGFQRYVVEMAIFVDYALYNRWYSRSQARDHWGRYYEAIQNIQYYFVQVANGRSGNVSSHWKAACISHLESIECCLDVSVCCKNIIRCCITSVDMRYSTIREYDFSINVRLVGIYIAASPSESYWTERSEVRVTYGSTVYSNMYKSLQLFEEWLPTKMSQLGFTFDQATVFSGNNLYDGYYCSDGAPCSKSGLGEVASICQLTAPRAYSATINKEVGMYASIQTAAHELGHNLGANHDGDQNGCSGNDQYVMASAPNVLSESNFDNTFKFSSCSLWYFRNNLARVTMNGKGNCLLAGSSSATVVAPPNFATYAGQQYSADQQCQNIYGPSSFYCAGGGSRDQTICQSMECWSPDKGACATRAEQRAADGTKCGNNKWCMKGHCVYDGRSPAATETCAYGDYKDRVHVFSGAQMSCYDMGRLQPHSCYLNRTAVDCCQTCATIRDNSKPTGCAYGDKDPDFCRSKAKKSNCYEASFADTCCGSCNREKSNKVGCEYGDKADFCSTSRAYNCYQSGKDCCETCQKFYDSRYPGCEYGDQAPWCSSTALTREMCTGSTGSVCCASCRSILARPIPPNSASSICPQGDKADWCASYVKGPEQCKASEVVDLCCRRCAPYRRN